MNKFRDNKTLLIGKAKHNTALQSLIDNINTIDISKLTDQPKWVRDGLTRIKAEKEYANYAEFVLANCKDGYNEDFTGEVFRYTGIDQFIPFGKSQLLIVNNSLLFVTDKGIYCDISFTSVIDNKLNERVSLGNCKFTEYQRMIKEELNKKYSGVLDSDQKEMFTIKKY
jgi:hypothetical protein